MENNTDYRSAVASGAKAGVRAATATVVKYVIVGAFVFIVGWYALSVATNWVMSPITAVTDWVGDKKAEVVETIETGKAAATDAAKTGLETAKGLGADALAKGEDALAKAKEMLPKKAEPEAVPAPAPEGQVTEPAPSCWKNYVPFIDLECKV